MNDIKIYYNPNIDEEEKKIFKEVFNNEKISFVQYKTKGISGGVFDIQFIIDFLTGLFFPALLATGTLEAIKSLVKKIFKRNNKNIADNNSRPRYTNIMLRIENKIIIVSNVNKEKKITIAKLTANFDDIKKRSEKGMDEYSDKKLEKYIFED